MAVNIVALLPRTGAIVLAVVLLIVSAATIGVINNNEGLRRVRDYDGPTTGIFEDVAELQALILSTQGSAAWLIVMTIGIVIAEAIAIVLIHYHRSPGEWETYRWNPGIAIYIRYYEAYVIRISVRHAGDSLQRSGDSVLFRNWNCLRRVCRRVERSTGRMRNFGRHPGRPGRSVR
ncbi:hypothetical protein GBAR_LOCUS2117 [Geodia barretti]|uniref:Uncharacterized protein n=1 Tax=Geodia barretti TaxID=519541 RepID=A0AA35VXJ6_GEOBA|nr:hypothetical protein GBAR_LOCUS2117 [Geodia barretti]